MVTGPETPTPIRRLWLAVLFGYLSLGATLQALPAYVPSHFGGGPLASGTAVGIAFVATAGTRPFAGRLADTGRARPVVLLGGILGALGGLGHLLAPNLAVLLLARLVMGAGEAALFSGALPWVLADATPARRGRVVGWFGLSMWGGLALGPVIATGLSAVGGFSAVWYAVAALALGSAALVATTRSQHHGQSPVEALPRRWSELLPANACLPGLAFGLASYGYGTIAALLLLHLRTDLGTGPIGSNGTDSYALAVFATAFLLTRALGSPTVDRFGGRAVGRCSVAVEAVGLVLIGVGTSPTIVLAGTVLAGAGVSLMYPSTVAMTLQRTAALRTGTSVGVMTSFWDLGILIAGPLGGAIAAAMGYPVTFWIAAGMSIASLVVISTLLRVRPSPARSDTTAPSNTEPSATPSPARQ